MFARPVSDFHSSELLVNFDSNILSSPSVSRLRQKVQGEEVALETPKIRMPKGAALYVLRMSLQSQAKGKRHQTHAHRTQ